MTPVDEIRGFVSELKLSRFEIEQPGRLRLALSPTQVQFGFEPSPGAGYSSFVMTRKKAPQVLVHVEERIRALLLQSELWRLPEQRRELCMRADALAQPSLHVRFTLEDGRGWSACYAPSEAPAVVTWLATELHRLGHESVARVRRSSVRLPRRAASEPSPVGARFAFSPAPERPL